MLTDGRWRHADDLEAMIIIIDNIRALEDLTGERAPWVPAR